jgi:hypothetical protein
MSDLLNTARWYVAHGVSVIPVKADGSKSPTFTGWRKYSTELPDDATLEKWFAPGDTLVGIGAVPGPASGNLVVLDFEHHGESAYFEWLQRLPPDVREKAERVPTVITPSGGRHLWCRLPDPQPGGKLARYAEKGKTKIEVRGEGHQVLAPGCPAECHQTGRLYEWADPPGGADEDDPFPVIDFDLWATFCQYAGQCNEHLPPEQPRDRDTRAGTPAGEDSPGNDFNARGTWAETGLFDAGWSWCRRAGEDKGFLTRPGKEKGISASAGMVSSKERGYPYLYVWSTSTDFPAETPISRFAVFAQLKHAGDYSEAAKDLRRLGYGERSDFKRRSGGEGPGEVDLSEFVMLLNTPDGKPVHPFAKPHSPSPVGGEEGSPPAEAKPFKWMSELDAQSESAKWVWTGYLARGGITLFSALWKSGKSTILSHLLKALDGSQSEFLGQPVIPGRVLYVTEEAESIWAERRDRLLIGDYVGMACRPFKMRPTMQEWREYLRLLTEQVRRFQFDVVVFDTLSKMWPVREENDAGQVEEALMPLWAMAQEEVAIMLVHHTRKSGGEQFVGSRGSGGLPAFCEILVEFYRASDDPKETQRVIKGMGRYQDTPVKKLVELVNGRYVSHGDPDDVQVRANHKSADWKERLRAALEKQGSTWATFDELRERVQRDGEAGRKQDMLASLTKWVEGGEVERHGSGSKGSPYMYRLPKIGSDECGSDPQE